MNDPAPFRLSLPQARRLKSGVIVCAALALTSYVVGLCLLSHAPWRGFAPGAMAASILLGMAALGLYVRRALGLAHQRQLNALAWLTDPHAAADDADQGAEIPSPRPSVDPEPSREEESQ